MNPFGLLVSVLGLVLTGVSLAVSAHSGHPITWTLVWCWLTATCFNSFALGMQIARRILT